MNARNMSVLTTAPTVWSSKNLIRMFVLLFSVFAGLTVLTSGSCAVEATFVGKRSSRSPCQRIFGGLLTMLKMANFTTWLMFREKRVCADANQRGLIGMQK